MPIRSQQIIKSTFETGDIPTQQHFADFVDSVKPFRQYDALAKSLEIGTTEENRIVAEIESAKVLAPTGWDTDLDISFFITKMGRTNPNLPYSFSSNPPEIILSYSLGSVQFRCLRFAVPIFQFGNGKILLKGAPIDPEAAGFSGHIVISKDLIWDVLKSFTYDIGASFTSPFAINTSCLIRNQAAEAPTSTTLIRQLQSSMIPPVKDFYNSLITATNFTVSFSKDFGFDKAADFMFISKMGLANTSLPYNFSSNNPEIIVSWFRNSDNAVIDICSITLRNYIYTNEVSRLQQLYGNGLVSRYEGEPLNDSGVRISFTQTKSSILDFLKTNLYQITNEDQAVFIIPTSSVIDLSVPVTVEVAESLKRIHNIPFSIDSTEKLPKFYDAYYKKNKNIVVLVYGDSISARDLHTTFYEDSEAAKRPPLMNSRNIMSQMWEHLKWGTEEFFRYDAPGIVQTGTFNTVTAINTFGITQAIWDDIAFRPSYTRFTTGAGSVSIQMAVDVQTLNFIYRTDLGGSAVNTVSISGGANRVQVYNYATLSWVEANGFTFSMLHPPIGNNRGSTKFQERLRMRASNSHEGGSFNSRAIAKTVTITKTGSNSSRFMYWGFETSLLPYMLTIVNSARGSQAINSMIPFLEDDAFDWLEKTPNVQSLLIHQIYLNQGASLFGSSKSFANFESEWLNYFLSTSPVSFKQRSIVGGVPWQKYETVVWNANPLLGGMETVFPFGWKVWNNAIDGPKTVFDNFQRYSLQYKELYDETGTVFVNISQALVNEAKAKYGEEWNRAFISSSTKGESFYNDVTHPNDYGCSVIARWLKAAVDFIYI